MSQTLLQHSMQSEIKQSISVSIPLVASQLIYASTGFVGTIMVAHLGKDALAASVLVSMVWFSLSVLFFGILNAVSVLVSHQHGANNTETISEIMGQSYILGAMTLIVMVLVLMFVPFFLRLSAQPPEVLALAYQYMYSLLWSLPGLIALIITEQFLAGIGHTKLVLRISMMVVPIEIPLIYVLIFGKWGFPVCGIAGIGYGLAMTYTISSIGLILYLLYAKKYRKYHIFNGIRKLHFSYQKEFVRVGLPIGMMHLIEVGSFAVATFWIARFGTTVLAAHQIVIQFLSFAITLVFAMSQAVTIRVGLYVGRQDLQGVQYAIYAGMLLNFCCAALIALALFLFPDFFLSLDINLQDPKNKSLAQNAVMLLSISAALILFDNLRIIGFGALRGLKDTRFPMYISFISFGLIGLSSAYLFAFTLGWQARGIWWGLTLGIFSGAFILFFRLRHLLKTVDLAKIAKIHVH